MRGATSYIAERFTKVNNKYLKFHDNNKPSKFNMYFDENKLYGWAMSHYLPYG